MSGAGCDSKRHDVEIEEAVLSYLGRHPNAADTLDGIANWWLPRQRLVTAQARIEAVLLQLVDEGVLQMRRLPNGAALYTLETGQRPPQSQKPDH